MICRAIPYEGNEPYVFLSYCHKDKDFVYPLLEQMVRDGYRIWYDDGNHAGDDWLENIANHLNNCKVCVAMISERSANSHNCRNEISFAIECKKKVLAVLLENFRMPVGMRLQLGSMHYIKKQDYPSDHMLLCKLYEATALAECKTTPGSLPMRNIESGDKQRSIVQEKSSELAPNQPSVAKVPNTPSDSDKVKVGGIEDDSEPQTIRDEGEGLGNAGDEDCPTMRADTHGSRPLIVRLSSGEAFILQSALTQIGRSQKKCDIVLSDNVYIGNCHAEIIQYKNRYYLRDKGSVNGTFINGRQLSPEDRQELKCNNLFTLYNEHFLFLDDEFSKQIISGKKLHYLRCITTQAVKILPEGQLLLDRSHKWEDGTLNDAKISRNKKHALLTYENGELRLKDLGSLNGTYVDEIDIRTKGEVQLMVGNQIRLGDTVLEVGVISLQGDEK